MTKSPSLFTAQQELEAVLTPDLAADFIAHRKLLKKPMTPKAGQLMAKKLRTFPNPGAVVEQSILKGWCDVWPVDRQSVDQGARSTGRRGVEGTREKLRQELADEQISAPRQEDSHSGHAGGGYLLDWERPGRPH